MSNKTSNHLFELIKSLSKSEKRYFKLYASRHTIGEQNNYVMLFDYIDGLNQYDEDKLFQHFKNKAFLNQFSTTKSRLYQLILKSLDLFHSSNSIEAQLNANIHSADILFNKGLYKQAEKLYKQAEKQALKHHFEPILLNIKNKIKKLYEKEMYSGLTNQTISDLYTKEQQICNSINLYNFLWKSKSLLFIKINQIGNVRTQNEITELEQIINPIKQINIDCQNNQIQYLYHHIFSTYYFTIYDYKKSYYHLKLNLQLIKKDIHFLKQNFNSYFSVLTNLIYVCTKLEYYDEANQFLNHLKSLPQSKHYKNTTDIDVKYFSSKYSLELFLNIEQNNFQKAEVLISDIQEFYLNYDKKINGIRKAYIDFKIATVYLSQNKFKEALKWINFIINDKALDKRQDIYSFAKIIHLIIHFELKNYRYLNYALTSTKRFLKDKKRLYKFEELFLKLISKLSKQELNQFDLEEILTPFLAEVELLKQNNFEKTAFEYFDFYTWIKGKIDGKTYLELKMVS